MLLRAPEGWPQPLVATVAMVLLAVLQAAGLPQPKMVNGLRQIPIEGTSLVYSFDDAKAPERHTTQYFEMFGNRAIYHEGWFARTIHVPPWGIPENRIAADTWELFHVAEDFSMSTDVAGQHPDKLAEMRSLFLAEAVKYDVLPMDARRLELFNPRVAGRPDLMFGRTSLTLRDGMAGLLENDFINVKNASFTIDAEIDAGGGVTHQIRERVPQR